MDKKKSKLQSFKYMIKKFFLGIFCLLTTNFLFGQSEKNVTSDVKAVTIFLNRAQVTNSAVVNVPAGMTNLIFEDLSTKIIKPSIQVTAKGDITIMAVKHQINYLRNTAKNTKTKKLEDSITYYNDKIKVINAQKKIWQREEELILNNKTIAGEAGLTAQKLKEMADFYRTRLTEISNNLFALDKSLEEYNLKINTLRFQISEFTKDLGKPTSEIIVTVSAAYNTNATFDLNYIVPDAGWTPLYDLRAKDVQSNIQLAYKAQVFQNTGVDWKNVKIKLSTGNPAEGGVKPELATLFVGFFNPVVMTQAITNRGKVADNFRGNANAPMLESKKMIEDVEDEEKPSETIADKTEVTVSTFATEFEISIPYSIPSDGKPQLVDVKNYEIKTTYEYGCVPRKDFDAFLMAKLTNWEKYNLLSGPANVYFEGSFVGETYLNANNTKDTLAVSLGRDKRIVVKRIKSQQLSSKKFIGTDVKEELTFEIVVRNTKATDAKITIEDQIPVPKDKQIDVELEEAKEAIYNKNNGRITWKLNLKPNQTKTLVLKYYLKYPKSKQITFE